MIGEPLNDVGCLELITERAAEATSGEAVAELAARFKTTAALAGWIRGLPQRNDDGKGTEGPKVNCDVPQRLRLPADDPNCVERSALYMAAAELIDPEPVRRLATMSTPMGRHTFVVEDDVPVNLDPAMTRNALDAGLFHILEADDELDDADAFEWILSLAEEPASEMLGGRTRLRNAERAIVALRTGRSLPRNAAVDLGFVLALAENAATMFGIAGRDTVQVGARALRYLLAPRNDVALRIGGMRLAPDLSALGALGRVAARLGRTVGSQLLRAKLGAWGLAPSAIAATEKELNREGLTLGALAKVPEPGSLAALTTKALAQRKVLGG